jgi:LysM repeat protein
VRTALADLEARGIVEATEEHHPVHLHVAVLAAPGHPVTLPDLTHGVVVARLPRPTTPVTATANGEVALTPSSPAPTLAAARPPAPVQPGTYLVRQGDTLWDVAQKTGVTVEALAAANNRSPRGVLRPGTVLRLPKAAGR